MTTQETANRLVELCRQGNFEAAQKELFADDAVSKEPYATPEFEQETKGLPAILKKGEVFHGMVDTMHALDVSEPLVADNSFTCTMHMDVTMKDKSHWNMTELCVYKVKDGKIISEEFFL
ncbi:MAG: nuclear transport factor 2 family protein [Chitinophagaceae bacterium]